MAKQILSADVEIKGLMKAMKIINNEALPEAVAMTLNFTADQVTKEQIKNVKNDFTIRTPFTLRSMESGRARPYRALNKAGGKNLGRMFSRSGTFSSYLWLQEEDKNINGIDGPIPIATKTARTSKSERKAIAKRYRISRTTKLQPGNFGDSGKQFVGKVNGRMGLWERFKKGLRLIRNLEHDSAKIKGTRFHQKAVKRKASNNLIVQRFRKYGQKAMNKAVRKIG